LALRALAAVGGAEAVPRIEPLLESENPYVAISAANAILSILTE
jgi:HEAT repeat protein